MWADWGTNFSNTYQVVLEMTISSAKDREEPMVADCPTVLLPLRCAQPASGRPMPLPARGSQ